ncbi:MAG: helix-turn-helix domain-containing protein [Proteobacteria bacterium]|nr:helix-turn-helix domain-containing protein [Pseudomonadota bacterium]
MTTQAFPVPLADSGTPPESAIPGTSPPADPRPRDPEDAIVQPEPTPTLAARYLRTPEAAKFLGLSGRTLEKHRTFGTGPAYRKLGGRVIYRLEDLQAWAEAGARSSTSDPGLGITTARGPGRPPRFARQ